MHLLVFSAGSSHRYGPVENDSLTRCHPVDIAALCEQVTTKPLQGADSTKVAETVTVTRSDFEWVVDVFNRCRHAKPTEPQVTRMVL
jgi:hypothetical protein